MKHEQPAYWRSFDELAATPEFQRFVDDEFPNRKPDWNDPASRRTFLRLMGASAALAGVTACTHQPPEKIVPYVRQPEEMVPGKPLYYATAIVNAGLATGVLAESHLGRPTKLEGNPDHPASLGATDAITQASILTLYDPDRSQTVMHLGNISSWEAFQAWFNAQKNGWNGRKGQGVYLLTEAFTSPTLAGHI